MSEFTLSRDAILGHCKYKSSKFTSHMVIAALTNAIKHEDFSAFLKGVGWENEDGGDKKEFECCLLFEGHKLPLVELCARWEEQMDEMIRKKAYELLQEDSLSRLSDVVHEFSNELKKKAKKELDIEIEEW